MKRWAVGTSLLLACCAVARAETAQSILPQPQVGAPHLVGMSADSKSAGAAARSLKAHAIIASTVGVRGVADRERLAQAAAAEQVEAADQVEEEDPALIAAGNPSLPPFEWEGVLQFDEGNGRALLCTGQFIAPRIVLTAGHCVKDEHTGAVLDVNKMAFFLQYQNHTWSHAYRIVCDGAWNEFPAKITATMSQQQKFAAFNQAAQWDYAMLLTDSDSKTGYFHYAINWRQSYHGGALGIGTGYPHDLLSGKVVEAVRGNLFFADILNDPLGTSIPNELALWHGNPKYSHGASGGAWVVNFNPQEGPENNILVSVDSFEIIGKPGISFGPYFTNDFNKMFQFVSGGCKG